MELSVTLNEFNRSLGLDDYYPFVISATVRIKLDFVHRRLCLLVGAPRQRCETDDRESGVGKDMRYSQVGYLVSQPA